MDNLERARRCADTMYADDRSSTALGIRIDVPAVGSANATMLVREDMMNGFDMCHGGLVFTLADTAFAFACNAYNRLTVAAGASIEFLRPVALGDELCAVASEEVRGKRTSFYRVEVFNQRDELVALFRGRAASRNQSLFEAEESDTESLE